MRLDAVDVRAFKYRALQDGFEGEAGYSRRSGLFRVDFADPFRPRTPRRSALYFTRLARHRGVLRDHAPSSSTATPTSDATPTSSKAPPSHGGGGDPAGSRCPSVTGGASGRAGSWGGVWCTAVVALALAALF